MSGNALVPIEADNAKQAIDHDTDVTAPALVAYNLDMDVGIISFTFTETVNTSSFVPSLITLQNAVTSTSEYQLTGGLVTKTDGIHVNVTITVDDLNEIKKLRDVAVSKETTFMTFPAEMVKDMTGNKIVALVDGLSARRVTIFTNDTTKPQLVCFDLDLNTGTLTLIFNETIDATTVNMTQISLQNKASAPVESHTFSADSRCQWRCDSYCHSTHYRRSEQN